MVTEEKIQKGNKSKLNVFLKKANDIFGKSIKKLRSVKVSKNLLKYVLGAIVVIFLIMGLGNIVFKGESVSYPVIFNTGDGDLLLLDSKTKGQNEDATKLAVSESVSNVVYANTTERYVLFKKDNDLYLYDKNSDEETVKVIENVSTYLFNSDDKYVVMLDKDDSLYVYNYKTNVKIESDVSEIIDVSEDKIVFEKDDVIYIRSINPKKDNRERVTAEYGSYIQFSKDGKNVIYINKDNDLVIYNTRSNKDEKVASDVKNYYCDDSDCEKLFYVEAGEVKKIYYFDGKKETKVAEGINAVLGVNVEHKQVVYSTTNNGTYTVYFQVVGKDAVKVDEKLSSIRSLKIFEGKELYYITGKNEVKYAKINGSSVDKSKSLGTDVTGYLYLYKEGYAFVTEVDSNSNGTLYLAKNGKAKRIDNNVNSSLITVNRKGNKIYYFKDYDMGGTLYVTSGSKNVKIDENIYTFAYIDDNLLYYIKDYSGTKSRGDLFIYRKGKSNRVYEGVSRIANSPVSFKLK